LYKGVTQLIRTTSSSCSSFIFLRSLDAKIFNKMSKNRHLTFILLYHLTY